MSRVFKAVNWALDGIITGTGFLGIVILLVLSLFILFVVLARFVAAINIPGFFDTAMYVYENKLVTAGLEVPIHDIFEFRRVYRRFVCAADIGLCDEITGHPDFCVSPPDERR